VLIFRRRTLAGGGNPPDLADDLRDLAINCRRVGPVKSSNLNASV